VREGKGNAAGEDESHGRGKQRLVALEEEGPVDDALGIDGEDGIEQQDGRPEERMGAGKREESLRAELPDGERNDGGGEGEEGEDAGKGVGQGLRVPKAAEVEAGSVAQDAQRVHHAEPEGRHEREAVGNAAEQERRGAVDDEKFSDEKRFAGCHGMIP